MHPRHPVLAPLHCLQLFAQAVKVERLLEEVALNPEINFWVYTTNVLLNEAAIQWSKVFGSTEEQTHWTKSFDQTDQVAPCKKGFRVGAFWPSEGLTRAQSGRRLVEPFIIKVYPQLV